MRRKKLAPLIFIVLARRRLPRCGAWRPTRPRSWASTSRAGCPSCSQPTEDASDDALAQTIEIIRSRVDALGVAEPEITRQGDSVVVQLPGVKNQQRALELVGATAELRFRPGPLRSSATTRP